MTNGNVGLQLFESLSAHFETLVEGFNDEAGETLLIFAKSNRELKLEISNSSANVKVLFYYFREKVAFRWYLKNETARRIPPELFSGVLSANAADNINEIRLNHQIKTAVNDFADRLFYILTVD